jgi:hypothetical protein
MESNVIMKLFYVTVLLAVVQASPPVPRQAANDSTGTGSSVKSQTKPKQTAPTQPEPVIKTDNTPRQNSNGIKQRDEDAEHPISVSKLPPVMVVPPKRDWADWGYWIFSFVLVVVGGLQVGLLWRTLGAIQRQANEMKRQADLMDKQATKLEESVAVADKAAVAAQGSADAAKQNIELFISKERARVSVEINPFNLNPPVPGHTVSYNLRVRGSADAEAYVTSSAATALVTDSQETPTGGFLEMPMIDIPNVLIKHNPVENRITFLQPKIRLEQSEIDSITQGKAFVHFWGFIKYKDVFERNRETKFRYVWKLRPGLCGLVGNPGNWEKCGQPEDNKET